MSGRLFLATFLAVVLIGTLGTLFEVQRAEASGTIYIRADGSIDPPTAPISRNGDVYTFSGNVSDPIIIEKDDVLVNGNSCFLAGTGPPYPELSGWSYTGFNIAGAANVTIKNVIVTGFLFGVSIGPGVGGHLIGNNVVFNNTLTSNGLGVYINSSWNNTITNNMVVNNTNYGLDTIHSRNSAEARGNYFTNNFVANNTIGICLDESDYTIVTGNTVQDNQQGFLVTGPSNGCIIHHNNIVNNTLQVNSDMAQANDWDNGSEGNYWSNYTGTDSNGDGIGDSPHVVDLNNQDHYPLMAPYAIPEFPSFLMLLLFMMGTLLAVIASRMTCTR